jgi:hypothetical protein
VQGEAAQDGTGVTGISNRGAGIFGRGKPAGRFQGVVEIKTQEAPALDAWNNNADAHPTITATNAGHGPVLYCSLWDREEAFILGHHAGSRRFHINSSGSFVAGSDFAEALPARGDQSDYEPGDVLVLSEAEPGSLERAARPYDHRLVGVYSTRPAVIGADKGGESRIDDNELPVAILGIVPTKASVDNGPIQPGDLLTTSNTPGRAMKATLPAPQGTLLGKALEALTEGVGTIRVLVTLR